jgi:hypothetical protein
VGFIVRSLRDGLGLLVIGLVGLVGLLLCCNWSKVRMCGVGC